MVQRTSTVPGEQTSLVWTGNIPEETSLGAVDASKRDRSCLYVALALVSFLTNQCSFEQRDLRVRCGECRIYCILTALSAYSSAWDSRFWASTSSSHWPQPNVTSLFVVEDAPTGPRTGYVKLSC